MSRDLADLVDVSRRTAAAAQRRVAGRPRDPALVLAELGPVQARLADLNAATIATAAQTKVRIAAGVERIRQAVVCGDRALRDARRSANVVTRAAEFELRAVVAEHRALQLLHDQLVGELADARPRAL